MRLKSLFVVRVAAQSAAPEASSFGLASIPEPIAFVGVATTLRQESTVGASDLGYLNLKIRDPAAYYLDVWPAKMTQASFI